jgi:hypothetical protein
MKILEEEVIIISIEFFNFMRYNYILGIATKVSHLKEGMSCHRLERKHCTR